MHINKIKISSLDDKSSTARNVYDKIIDHLIPDYIFSESSSALAYHALNAFNFRRKIGFNNEDSIQDACAHLIKKLGFSISNQNVIDYFIENILGFNKLPYIEKKRITNVVIDDLRNLSEIILKYEQIEFIQSYKQKKIVPRNQKQRMFLEFYERCLKEKNEIINYLINGIDQRAIENSKIEVLGLTGSLISSLNDRPYKYNNIRNQNYYDFDNIDEFRHRLDYTDVLLRDVSSYKVLYERDKKDQFYEKLSKVLSPKDIFTRLSSEYKTLPHLNDRLEIINELKTIYDGKYWYAFYALILPQVEGVFTLMCKLFESKASDKSLPDKVTAMREFYEYSEHHFDYFEFILPVRRNKFTHIGKDDDIEIKSLDLLYDLYYIINVYKSLDHPLIEFSNFISHKPSSQIKNIDELSRFTSICNRLKNKGLVNNEIMNEIESYTKDINILPILSEIFIEYPKKLQCFQTNIIFYSNLCGKEIDMRKMSNPSLQKEEGSFKEIYQYYDLDNDDTYRDIISISKTINSINELFRHLNDPTKQLLKQIIDSNENSLDKINNVTNW